MGCVNIKSKEFKDLATRNNLDTNLLELIIHKYWLETGSEENFPSDEYIQKELGNTQYEEPLESVRDLWKREYSTPREYRSFEELQAAQEKAAGFFPASAIVYYKNAKGNYVLSIKQPVEETNKNSLDNLISEENSTFAQEGNGEINYKRTVGEGQAFTRGISEIHAGASIILRGVGQANQEKSGNPRAKYARHAKEGKRQEVILGD